MKEEEDIADSRDFVDTVTRVVALVVGIALFISDRYLKVIDPPIEMWIYGVIASVAMGNKQALDLIGLGSKKKK